MTTKVDFDHLRIASPCPANWDQMSGDDCVRFCDLCNLHVYNIELLMRPDHRGGIVFKKGFHSIGSRLAAPAIK